MADVSRRKAPVREEPPLEARPGEDPQGARLREPQPPRETRLREPSREARLRDAIELFYFAYRSFTAEPDRILAEHGLGRAHHRILYFIGRHPDVSVNALLALLAVSKQALHAPLRMLLAGKWVAVRPDTQDRRFKRLRLTEAGKKLEGRLTGAQMRHLETVFSAAGGPAEAAWKSLMRAIAERRR